MTRRPGARPAPARALVLVVLIVGLVVGCAPSAAGPGAPVTAIGSSPASTTPSLAPTRAPAPSAAPRPTATRVVETDDDDVEGDPAASQPAGVEASPSPAPTATPEPTPEPTPLPPKKPFAVSLYHKGDWVGQYTLTWCVGASIQMMVNIALPGQDRTKETQAEYQRLAQGREELDPDRGAGSSGWARALTELGVGQYDVGYEFTFEDAIRTAARAMAQTKRPVGLLVWGGKHAWVMTGFTADADPRIHADFKVTGVRVVDPLYPRHNADLGPSPEPNALLKPSTLDNYFVGWRWWSRQRARSASPSPSPSGSSSTSTYASSGSWRLVLPASA